MGVVIDIGVKYPGGRPRIKGYQHFRGNLNVFTPVVFGVVVHF
jgi:hypothetical protein